MVVGNPGVDDSDRRGARRRDVPRLVGVDVGVGRARRFVVEEDLAGVAQTPLARKERIVGQVLEAALAGGLGHRDRGRAR